MNLVDLYPRVCVPLSTHCHKRVTLTRHSHVHSRTHKHMSSSLSLLLIFPLDLLYKGPINLFGLRLGLTSRNGCTIMVCKRSSGGSGHTDLRKRDWIDGHRRDRRGHTSIRCRGVVLRRFGIETVIPGEEGFDLGQELGLRGENTGLAEKRRGGEEERRGGEEEKRRRERRDGINRVRLVSGDNPQYKYVEIDTV